MLTVEDLRNPKRKSGFDYVGYKPTGSSKEYQAQVGLQPNPAYNKWQGPRRATAAEAAQDYCDFMNGLHTPPPRLKSANHPKPQRTEADPEVAAARAVLSAADEAKREGRKGHVYLVCEENTNLIGGYVKIGHTYQEPPQARLNGGQTFNPRKLVMLYAIPGTPEDERKLHAKFIHLNKLGEWFHFAPEILKEFTQ